MTEILTESFCERCGTRYTFESAAPRQRRMGGLKVLGRGLKNFVMSDDSSLDEAFAEARSDVERDATSQQLDAFHRTFNFCMSCRQYTCANCWNGVEARCLSCAPLAIAETAPVLDDVDPDRLRRLIGPAAADAFAPNGAVAAHVHVPEMVGAEDGAAEEAIADQAHEHVLAIAPPLEAVTPAPAEPALAAPTETPPASIGGLVSGQTIDAAVAAYEAAQSADAAPVAAEAATPVASPIEVAPAAAAIGDATIEAATDLAALVQEPAVAAEMPAAVGAELPAPLAAAPTDAAVAAAAPPEAVPLEAPSPKVAEVGLPGVDVIAQPVWPTASPAPSTPAAGPGSTESPSWPTGPRWPTAIPARDATPPSPVGSDADPLAALMSRSTTDAMWAASSRDVLQPVAAVPATAAVQPCVNCGISLSATARFCRRCGTPQG